MKEASYIQNGEGKNFDYSQDHVFIKLPSHETNGELCLVEDILKPGFHLTRHYHKIMVEIFYIIEGEIEFIFDDKKIMAGKGDTISVPQTVWHEVRSENGCKMLTLFKNGKFDQYLEKIAAMDENDFNNISVMKELEEEFDIYH